MYLEPSVNVFSTSGVWLERGALRELFGSPVSLSFCLSRQPALPHLFLFFSCFSLCLSYVLHLLRALPSLPLSLIVD